MTMYDCPCGQMHVLEAGISDFIAAIGTHVGVRTERGSWWVPLAYIGVHGVGATEVPALAVRYQWERIPGE